jgi:glycosyltransferase involved in cell wall biosynthesis
MVIFLSRGSFEREVAELGVPTEVIDAGRLRHPIATGRAILRISSAVRRFQPDLLLSWSARVHIYGYPASVLAGYRRRAMWWQHMIPHGHRMDRVATLMPAAAVGCWSNASQEAQRGMWPRRRTFVVNPGIVPPDCDERGNKALRESLDIADGRLVVGIVGRLQAWKGQDKFLEALAELRDRGRDVHGLIVGGDAFGRSPEYAASLARLVSELELDAFVTMTGQVPDAAPYIQLMDVAVNASDEEPFGIVLIEAMAAGVPVVAVAKGGPLDIVDTGVTGVLASNQAPIALADAIDEVIRDPRRREEMGEEAKRRCLERFTAQSMADRMAARFTEVARIA